MLRVGRARESGRPFPTLRILFRITTLSVSCAWGSRIPPIVMVFHSSIAASTSFKHFSAPTIVKSSPCTTQRTYHTGWRTIVGAAFPLANLMLCNFLE